MLVTFGDKFEKLAKQIANEKLTTAFDNIMGLTYLDSMVDVITQTPELRKSLHEYIQGIILGMMEFEYEDEDEEYMKDFV